MATFVAVAEGPTELLPREKAVLGARHTTIAAPKPVFDIKANNTGNELGS